MKATSFSGDLVQAIDVAYVDVEKRRMQAMTATSTLRRNRMGSRPAASMSRVSYVRAHDLLVRSTPATSMTGRSRDTECGAHVYTRCMKQNSNVETLPQLSANGKYLTDPDGKVVILRGFNLCSKTAQTPEQLGFDTRNATFLRDWGVSVVRLGLPWANIQPYLLYGDDGLLQYDMQFLASIKRTIQLLAESGIYTLVDFHQDAYSAPWGFGAPSWAMVAGGTNTPNYAWPINTFGGTTTYQINEQPCTIETDLNFAFDAFWNDSTVSSVTINRDTGKRFTLLEAYGKMLKFVSTYLSDQKGNILGYDPINEPEPGSQWTEGYIQPYGMNPNSFDFGKGCANFDRDRLARFYRSCAIPNLRAGHPEAMIWYEPNIYFDYNAPTFLPDLGAGNLGFNFHNYDTYHVYREPVRNALHHQSVLNVPLLCSEFGGTTSLQDIREAADINDQNMLSSIFWAWFNNAQFNFAAPPGGEATDPRAMGVVRLMSADLEPGNLNQDMLDALTRVYPRLIAGTPNSFSTEVTSPGRRFSFEYSTQLPDGRIGTGATLIVVPAGLFPNGFDVYAPGASTVNQLDGIVEIIVDSSTPTTISVEITSRELGRNASTPHRAFPARSSLPSSPKSLE